MSNAKIPSHFVVQISILRFRELADIWRERARMYNNLASQQDLYGFTNKTAFVNGLCYMIKCYHSKAAYVDDYKSIHHAVLNAFLAAKGFTDVTSPFVDPFDCSTLKTQANRLAFVCAVPDTHVSVDDVLDQFNRLHCLGKYSQEETE